MKILTAHQPVYLPWLGLFHKIALADEFVWYDDVQYQTKDWNNRNRIKTDKGPIWLSVPVQRTNHFEIKVSDVLIDNSQPWARKHWRSIEHTYGKAPYFHLYAAFLQGLYAKTWEKLSDLNREILDFFLDALGINVPIRTLSELSAPGAKSDRVLAMCVELKADIYIFGGEGKNYADVEAFRNAGVEPVFQEYVHPVYPQAHGDFVSHMSALDCLCNCGAEAGKILMSGNVGRESLVPPKDLRFG